MDLALFGSELFGQIDALFFWVELLVPMWESFT
jgi:hypothetical protein